MFQRKISKEEVRSVIENGEMIVDYPEDKPFPSKLLLGFSEDRPLHVVFAYDSLHETGYVVTAYVPNNELWNDDFRRKK